MPEAIDESNSRGSTLGLFEAFGIEIEYMIVEEASLDVCPVADTLLAAVAGGTPEAEVQRGPLSWSNELVRHVVEFKTAAPTRTLHSVHEAFEVGVGEATTYLAESGARLLPTGAHPWMDPARETRLWAHEFREIYALYQEVFGCRNHGWANLQSTHLNLPFSGDEQFGRLHAAVRLVLPILPALAASSPYRDGRYSGHLDGRLDTYRTNQARLPITIGAVVPEPLFNEEAYRDGILEPIREAFAPFDPGGITSPDFLNSRGAIARFDRNAIEIRVLDTQECPRADLAIVELIVEVLRALTQERWATVRDQKRWSEHDLAAVLHPVITQADGAPLAHARYAEALGAAKAKTAGRIWWHLAEELASRLSDDAARTIERLLSRGPLARALLDRAGTHPSRPALRDLYATLADCLANNRLFGVSG